MSQTKILVIDDEFPIRYLVEHQLRSNDYEVHSAKDGPSGLRAARAYQPDLILLDIRMPGMDGFQVCEQIRKDPETATTPIIFITARMTPEDKSRAHRLGGNDYLMKPFQASELLSHIDASLQQSRQTEEHNEQPAHGRITAFYSPKGGVGTTTLAIQLSEAIVIRQERPVALLDLDLPLGGIAPMLNLPHMRHILDLLSLPQGHIEMDQIRRFAQRHRQDLLVLPAPGRFVRQGRSSGSESLKPVVDVLAAAGYLVVLDLGSKLSGLTLQAMRLADVIYVVTSGQPVANKLHNAFMASAAELGLEANRLLPVINELHGNVDRVELSRVPVARIPHATEQSRSQIWLRDQGLRKMVSVAL
jgi:DNA-binding response OmpR family regulator